MLRGVDLRLRRGDSLGIVGASGSGKSVLLKCMVGLSNQILGGDSGRDQAKQWFMCMTGTDNPGSGHGVPGAIEGGLDSDAKVIKSLDLGFGPMADALGGAKDLYDIMNNDKPILFTGR